MLRALSAFTLLIAAPFAASAQETPAVAAPGIRLNEDGANAPSAPSLALRPIEPANALERIFISALEDPTVRPVFRRMLLDQNVAVVMASAEAGAAPREIAIGNDRNAAFIFTSSERVDEVMGPETPRQVMTGRAAFERLRGKNVILNPRLMPMLTLEPDDLIAYLAAPVPRASAGPAQ